MGRPKKSGLNYFPLDTDFFRDRKIKRLRRTFGDKGVSIYIYLLAEIYRDKGYYVCYDENLVVDVANDLDLSENLVRNVIDMGVSFGLFDNGQYGTNRILTSKGIQERYFGAIKGDRINCAKPEYFIDGENVSRLETPVSRLETPVSRPETTEKGPKTPLNKTKLNKNKYPPTPLSKKSESLEETGEEPGEEPCLQDVFVSLIDLWNTNFPEGDPQRRSGSYIPSGFEAENLRETWPRYPTLDRFREVFAFAAREDFAWNFRSVLKLPNFEQILTKIKKSGDKPGKFTNQSYEGDF